MTTISTQAAAAREGARHQNGKFGPQVRGDNDGVDLSPTKDPMDRRDIDTLTRAAAAIEADDERISRMTYPGLLDDHTEDSAYWGAYQRAMDLARADGNDTTVLDGAMRTGHHDVESPMGAAWESAALAILADSTGQLDPQDRSRLLESALMHPDLAEALRRTGTVSRTTSETLSPTGRAYLKEVFTNFDLATSVEELEVNILCDIPGNLGYGLELKHEWQALQYPRGTSYGYEMIPSAYSVPTVQDLRKEADEAGLFGHFADSYIAATGGLYSEAEVDDQGRILRTKGKHDKRETEILHEALYQARMTYMSWEADTLADWVDEARHRHPWNKI